MVHGELGALNITGFILPYATTNWLVREYSSVSEGGRRGMITFDGLFSLIKIMLKTAVAERWSSVWAPVHTHRILK